VSSIATLLGITWDGADQGRFRLHPHAAKMAATKGFSERDVLDAANNPTHTYENGRYAGQMRHVRGNLCVIVDPIRRVIVTVYANTVETALRGDQADRDALQYGRSLAVAGV
jgi:hypothetical protein